MEALLIHPKNPDQLDAIKAVLKALKVPYEPHYEVSAPKATKKEIDKAYSELREGNFTVLKQKICGNKVF